MATIDNLTLELNADSTKAIKAIDALSQSMASLKVNMPKGTAFNGTVKGLQSLRTELSKISTSAKGLEKIKALGDIAKGLSKIGENTLSAKKLQGTADGLTSISSAINGITYEGITKIERLSSALSKMPKYSATKSAISSASAKTSSIGGLFSSIFGSVKTSGTTDVESRTGDAEAQKASDNTSKIVGLFATLKTVGTKVHPVVAGITTALGFMGDALKKIISPLTSVVKGIQHFVKSLARIAFYRFIRSILKDISQGLKEGIQNLAKYSKAMNELDAHSANHVMSRYASEFLYLKNAIATAVMPVLRAMIPLIEQVINKIIDFINVLAQIGSAFFGGTFTKAKYFWVDYADSLDTANKRAKALHHQLAGFDELNNLTAPSGGGSADLLDPSKMFEEADISSKILDKVNKIKEVFENLKKLGTDILNNIIIPIKNKVVDIFGWFAKLWDRVYPNLQKVWELVTKIWDKLAKPFTEGFIKGFLESLFGDPNSDSAEKLIEFIGKITDKVGEASEKITGYLDKLDTDKIKKFGEEIGKILGNIAFYAPFLPIPFALFGQPKFYEDIDKFAEKLNKVKDKIGELAEKTKENAHTFLTLLPQAVGFYVGYYVGSIGTSIEWIKSYVFPALEKIGLFIISIPLRIGEASSKIPSLIAEAFRDAYDKIIEWGHNIKDWCKNELPNLINSIVDWFTKLPEALVNIGKNMIIALFNGGASMGQWLYDKFGGFFGKAFEGIKDSFEGFKKGMTEGYYAVPHYATGGFVDNGDLFIANERGAEMVGSIGNQTAVANNDQITQAIATATYNAMSKALSENNGSVTFVVEGDGDQMYKIWQKKNKEYGRRTGLAY